MDVNDLRIGVTVLSFVAFMGIMAWALSRKNAARFADAAQLPFREAEPSAEKGSQP
jgi:cytochrome c oxidase cbb3-type subunit 4